MRIEDCLKWNRIKSLEGGGMLSGKDSFWRRLTEFKGEKRHRECADDRPERHFFSWLEFSVD